MIGLVAVRRGALATTIVGLVSYAGAAVSAACGTFGATAEDTPDGSTAEGGAAEGGAAEGGAAEGGFTCPVGAFCDTFDDDVPLPRAWDSTKKTGAGSSLSLFPGAGFGDSGALYVTHKVTATGDSHSGYLKSERGKNGPAKYRAVLAFAARIQPDNASFMLGPRIYIETVAESRAISVDFHDDKTSLGLSPGCDAGCVPLTGADAPIDRAWHRYVLTADVRPPNGTDYGDLELTIDGKSALKEKVPFAMSSPSAYGALVGLTYANPPSAGALAFDDVSFVLTPTP